MSTLEDSVARMVAGGAHDDTILRRLKWCGEEASIRKMIGAARKGRRVNDYSDSPRGVSKINSFHVTGLGLLAMDGPATRRGMTRAQLCERLLQVLAADEALIDNVLDDRHD